MIYLDHGATSFVKPRQVSRAVQRALERCANPGRGGYGAARSAAEVVYGGREAAGKLFDCGMEQVVFTSNCTHGLNMAIRSLVKPGSHVVISGFEHNAVTRPLHGLGAECECTYFTFPEQKAIEMGYLSATLSEVDMTREEILQHLKHHQI